ncbi:MAG: hypothetical protein ACFFDF_12945 [Candidatus Odinarchaeota archaeon]
MEDVDRMYYSFNSEGFENYKVLLLESYDKLMTWIFDEAVIYQNDDTISKKVVSASNKLPLNL